MGLAPKAKLNGYVEEELQRYKYLRVILNEDERMEEEL